VCIRKNFSIVLAHSAELREVIFVLGNVNIRSMLLESGAYIFHICNFLCFNNMPFLARCFCATAAALLCFIAIMNDDVFRNHVPVLTVHMCFHPLLQRLDSSPR